MIYLQHARDSGQAVAGGVILAAYIWGSLFTRHVVQDYMKPNPEKYHGIHRAK